MFKKKSLFIFIIMFVFMFIDIKGVWAAKELTCVYKSNNLSRESYVFTQNSSGDKFLYSYYFPANLDNDNEQNYRNLLEGKTIAQLTENWSYKKALGWYYSSDKKEKLSVSEKKQNNNIKSFDSCPKYLSYVVGAVSVDEAKEIYDEDVHIDGVNEVYLFENTSVLDGHHEFLFSYDKNIFSENEKNIEIDIENQESYDESNIGRGKKCSEMNLQNYWLNKFNESDWDNVCLYAHQDDDDCLIFQLNFNSSTIKNYFSMRSYSDGFMATIGNDFSISDLKNTWNGYCPINLYSVVRSSSLSGSVTLINYEFSYYQNRLNSTFNDKANKYSLRHALHGNDGYSNLVINDPVDIKSCEDLLSEDMIKLLSDIKTIMQVAIPLVLVALGIADFARAVFGTKEDDMKKSSQRFLKRLIIAIIIFFVPSFLEVLLTIASKIWPSIDPSLCGIL